MMKRKKVWLCLLAGLLSVGMLAACSKDDPAPADTTVEEMTTVADVTADVTEAATADAETEPETAEPETYPEIDLPSDPDGVAELIDSIPEGNLDSEWTIDLAYAAWAALPEADRAKVENYEKLRVLLQDVADAHIVKDYHDSRIPHGELLLGGYCMFPYPTDEDMQTVVNANLDFLCGISPDQVTLDQFKKFGVGAIVSGGSLGVGDISGWGTWSEEGQVPLNGAKPIGTMVSAVPLMAAKDHEAIWGVDFRDEPGAVDFWWYDPVIGALNQQYSAVQTFANLLPNYGSTTQLGMHGYGRYVTDYAHRISGDILSLDHYIYDLNVRDGQYTLLRGLENSIEAAQDTDKDLMVILQLNRAPNQNRLTTLGEVKFQAYASMAFGAKYIVWGCYDYGWWDMQALDRNRQPTEQYYKMQECNADLKTLSPIFMRYTAVDQAMLNPSPLREFLASRHPVDGMGMKTLTDLAASEGTTSLLMGYYEKNIGEGEAFLFVNSDTFDQNGSNTETSTVTFKTASPASVVTAYVKGIPTILTPVDGVYTVQIKDADAVFVTVTEPDSLNVEPVAPIGQITIGGTDISEFSIVIPAEATERERQAAEVLVDIIEQATFKTLPVVTDAENPAHAIVLGKTARSTAALNTARSSVKNDGYVVMTEGGNLYISGNDGVGAGTLFGVYAFCEDYLNIGFFADGHIVIPTAASVSVADGVSDSHSPSFLFRESTNYKAMDQAYPLYQKYNGYSLFGDVNFAACGFGGNGLHRLLWVNSNYNDTVLCLSSEQTYATALAGAKTLLNCDPDAEFLACDISLDGSWTPCTCETCTATTAAEGTMGLILQFVNRLAEELKADYPNVVFYTSAAGDSMSLPATVRPAENVGVRVVLPTAACRFHALGDASCEVNAGFCTALESWTKVCKNVILLDEVTERTTWTSDYQKLSGNLLALYDTVQYLKKLGVVGYQQMGYDSYAGEFEALNAYLLSRLLWDADMTREEYSAEMDGFLKAYYGAGWTYIRQYIDKVYATEGIRHSDYRNVTAMMYRTDDKAFAAECFELWISAIQAADTAVAKKNTENSSVQMYAPAQALRDRNNSAYFRNLLVKYGYSTS